MNKNPNHDKNFLEDEPTPFAEECGWALLQEKRKQEKTKQPVLPLEEKEINLLDVEVY